MAESNNDKRSMGRYILKSSLVIFLSLLSSCKERSPNCDPFCEGDEWHVEEFVADPYPTIVPFEKNQVIAALEEDFFIWKLVNKDSLILSKGENKEIAFKCGIKGDTLILLSNENENPSKLVIKEESEGHLHLNLIGLFHAKISLRKKN